MEAPKRLYLSKNIYSTFLYQVPDPDVETEVEYIRADVFIEKVCKWFEEHYEDIGLEWLRGYNAEEVIENLKEYMEGE